MAIASRSSVARYESPGPSLVCRSIQSVMVRSRSAQSSPAKARKISFHSNQTNSSTSTQATASSTARSGPLCLHPTTGPELPHCSSDARQWSVEVRKQRKRGFRGEQKKGCNPNPGKIRTYSKPTPLRRCYCAMSRVVPPFCPMLGKRAVGPNSKRHLQLERKTEYDRKIGYYPARNPVFNHLPSYPDRCRAAGPASPFIWRAFADRHSRQSFHFCSHASVRALGEDRSRRYRRGIQQANCAAAALWLRDRSRHCRTPGSGYLFMRTRALGYRRFPAIFSSSVFGSRWLLCSRTPRRDCLPRLFASSHGNGLGNVARPGCYWNFLYAGARCGWLELVSRPAGTTRRSASFRH